TRRNLAVLDKESLESDMDPSNLFGEAKRRGSSPRAGVGEEAREEGEIPQKGQGSASRTVLETSLPLPQQDSSAIILAEVNKVPLIPESEENGLDVVNDLLGEDIVDGEDDGMELDEESVNVVGNEEDSDDGFNNLTDGDVAVEGNNDKIPEESHELDEEAIQPEVAEGKEQIPGEADKKKVVRKSLFKSSAIAGGSTKARMVQALVATRKRTVSKTAPRHGEGAKQQEEKGPSNPKPNIQEVERVCEQLVCSIFNLQLVFQFNKLYEHMIWKQTPCLQGGFHLEELLCLVPLNKAQISKVYMEAIDLVEIGQHERRMGIGLRRSNKYGGDFRGYTGVTNL
ncbi:hypothetical protein HID58_067027, partial [Brassica napus]